MLKTNVFRVSSGLGIGTILAMAMLFFGAQQAFPFFIGNVGTFMVKADSLTATELGIAPGVDENSNTNGGGLPTGELTATNAVVKGFVLEKTFNVKSVIGDIAQPEWKLQMASTGDVTIAGLRLNAVGVCAATFDAATVTVDGAGANTATFTDDFAIKAESAVLTDAGIQAGYLAANSLRLTNLTLKMVPGGYDKASCLPG